MDSFIPVPKNISDHLFKIIDGANQGVINYGIVLEAQMTENALDCDQTLFDTLLDLPQALEFQHPLQIDCEEFSVIMQQLCVLQSIVKTFKEYTQNFDNTTQVEARQINGQGLGFLSSDLLEEQVKQVNYIDMYTQCLKQLHSWVLTSKVKIKLTLQHKLFTWVKYILRDSESLLNNDTSNINLNRQIQKSKCNYDSDCESSISKNTDVKLYDSESNNEFIKSLDDEIEKLKLTWQEGTIMEQYFCDNLSKSGGSKSSRNKTPNLKNCNLYAGITLPSVSGYDSNNPMLTSNNSNQLEDNNQKSGYESCNESSKDSKPSSETKMRQCPLRSTLSKIRSQTNRSHQSKQSSNTNNKSDSSGSNNNNLNDSNQKDLSSLCIEKREGVFHQLQEGIEYFNKSIIGEDKKDKILSNYQSIIEKTTQANSTDANNADDLYQMIQDNMKEMDEIKTMLTTF